MSWFVGKSVSGYAAIIITLPLIGSFITLSLSIMEKYLAKIYAKVKCRPLVSLNILLELMKTK